MAEKKLFTKTSVVDGKTVELQKFCHATESVEAELLGDGWVIFESEEKKETRANKQKKEVSE